MLNNYLGILEESLKKKIEVLGRIREVNEAQAELLKEETFNVESFDRCVDEKDLYINELNSLDEGFNHLYDEIKRELADNKDAHAEQIKRLQELITEITDRSVGIQAQENRNKAMVEKYFAGQRMGLGHERRTSKAAYGYYQNMSKSGAVAPQFMDAKK